MRMLLVYPYVPYPLTRGTFHRVYNLARELGRHHEIDLFCLDDSASEPQKPVFEAFAKRVLFHPFRNAPWKPLFPSRIFEPTPATISHWTQPSVADTLKSFVADQSYDLIHFCDLVMWQYVSQLDPGALLVMDRSRVDLLFQSEELANLKLGLKERLLRRENLFKLRRYENRVASAIDATIVCGPDDETFLRKQVPKAGRIMVLPNGVDESYFSRANHPPTPDSDPTILFCGAMDYSPNINGLLWYFNHCDSSLLKTVPDRRILIVGKNPAPDVCALAQIPGVTVTGEVPDVRPYYQRAWIQMVPLLIGGGTRLKIVESLSIGTPVVSTPIGAQGLELEDGCHILLGQTPAAFTECLTRALLSPELRATLSEEGRRRVLEQYTWQSLGNRLSDYYNELKHQHE